MPRDATQVLAAQVVAEYNNLADLERQLRQYGAKSLADAVHRARRELQNDDVTGELNRIGGVNSGAIRP